jgi:uracil-DNA glycosylase
MADIEAVRPDSRKSLEELKNEWSSCIKCRLGKRRLAVGGSFVFGRGYTRGMMFIGDGPGNEEEKQGEPFVGTSGSILRRVLATLNLDRYYLSNLVACRSCVPQVDGAGLPVMRVNYQTRQPEQVFQDETPTPPEYLACLPRLYEEIYLVDPTIIVGLGGKACEALMGRPMAITLDHGEPVEISIPGAGYTPVLTEKKQEWLHRKGGELRTENAQNEVRYLFMPTLHPAYVRSRLSDMGPGSVFRQFVIDIKRAIKTHETYCEMVYGIVPTNHPETNDEDMHAQLRDEERGENP